MCKRVLWVLFGLVISTVVGVWIGWLTSSEPVESFDNVPSFGVSSGGGRLFGARRPGRDMIGDPAPKHRPFR
jgi:hypothetical protein